MMDDIPDDASDDGPGYEKLPGLYRSFDLPLLIEEGHIWRLEDAGRTQDGQPLFAVFVSENSDAC